MSGDESKRPCADSRNSRTEDVPLSDFRSPEPGARSPEPGARSPEPTLFRMPMELRWRDLDAFNHVNNSSFLTFLEEARIRWFNSVGTEWVTDTVAPLLAAVQINYRRPIPYPSNVVVELFAERVGNTSVTIRHQIASHDGASLYADGHVVMVWIDRTSGRPVSVPESVRKAAELS